MEALGRAAVQSIALARPGCSITVFDNGWGVREADMQADLVKLRQAVATVVDKGFILDRILQNHGNPMHSIVPAGNQPKQKIAGMEIHPVPRLDEAIGLFREG